MKFCYLDETGTGQNTAVILVGIVVDVQRMDLTKREWNRLFQEISNLARKPIKRDSCNKADSRTWSVERCRGQCASSRG